MDGKIKERVVAALESANVTPRELATILGTTVRTAQRKLSVSDPTRWDIDEVATAFRARGLSIDEWVLSSTRRPGTDFGKIFSHTTYAAWITRDQNIIDCTDAYADFFGSTRAATIGLHLDLVRRAGPENDLPLTRTWEGLMDLSDTIGFAVGTFWSVFPNKALWRSSLVIYAIHHEMFADVLPAMYRDRGGYFWTYTPLEDSLSRSTLKLNEDESRIYSPSGAQLSEVDLAALDAFMANSNLERAAEDSGIPYWEMIRILERMARATNVGDLNALRAKVWSSLADEVIYNPSFQVHGASAGFYPVESDAVIEHGLAGQPPLKRDI